MGGSRGDLRVAGQMCVAWHARVRLSSTWPEQPQALGWVVTHWHSYQTRLIGLCLCMSVQHIWSTRVSMQMHNLLLPFMHVGVLVLPFTHVCLFFFQSLSFAGRSCQGFCFFCCCFFKCKPFGDEIMHTRNRLTQFQPSRQRSYDAEGVQHTQKHKTFWKPGTCPCARTPSLLKYPAWNW